jgi:hypothetical protein
MTDQVHCLAGLCGEAHLAQGRREGGLVNGLRCYGGSAVILHYTLRLLLAVSGAAPLRLARILEEACRRGLLIRVGDGYRFSHRLLQDYFVDHREPGQRYVTRLEEQRRARLQRISGGEPGC